MRRFLACFVVVALAGAGAALAGRGDPQKRLTPADNARARSMLLIKADLPAFTSVPAPRSDRDFYCKAVDESDLTITGEAISRVFVGRFEAIGSFAALYASVADANASWRRGSSPAGTECLRKLVVSDIKAGGGRLISFAPRPTPRLAQRSLAFRFIAERSDRVRFYTDLVFLQQSRAQVGLIFESAAGSMTPQFVERLVRTVAGRLNRTMRRS
jgi:hypothetical protein